MALKGKLLKIYEQTVKKWDMTESTALTMLEESIELFSKWDPSKTNKYVEAMLNILLEESRSQEAIIDVFQRFHIVENKLSPKIFENIESGVIKQISPGAINNPKDIQQYKKFKDFDLIYQIALKYDSKKEKRNKIVDEETDIIYDKDDYLIVTPLTFASSCHWGVETKWCTTSKENPHYFSDYSNSGTLFYIIDKYRQHDTSHPMSKFAIHVRHGQNERDADIFNRPDHQMGRSMDRVLPPNIITLLMEYHKFGSIIKVEDIWVRFDEYKKIYTKLPLDDDWIQVNNIPDKHTNNLIFKCESFPSYLCNVKFDINMQQRQGEVLIRWVDEKNKKMILTHPINTIQIKELGRCLKNGTLSEKWEEMTFMALDPKRTYITVKQKILDDIIASSFREKISGVFGGTYYDNWTFKLINRKLSEDGKLSAFGAIQPSITNLGVYTFQIKGDFCDLTDYTATAVLNFTANEFGLMAGETDEIFWDQHFEDFNLLYYNEIGLTQLLKSFKTWVIETIITKSEKIMNDLYGDNALKIISKSSAFDEYLKSPDDVLKTFKPSKKSKQFFHRDDKLQVRVKPIVNPMKGSTTSTTDELFLSLMNELSEMKGREDDDRFFKIDPDEPLPF